MSRASDAPSRRHLLRALAAGVAGSAAGRFLPALAEAAAAEDAARAHGPARGPRRHCILLWMSGGPSQLDTFDPKPGHANGGPFQVIATAAAEVRFCEHLPRLAKLAGQMAVLRGVSSKEGDHGRGTFVMRTGRTPDPVNRFPTVGSVVSKELDRDDLPLPGFVSVNPFVNFEPAAFDPGFLGSRHAPMTIRPRDPRVVARAMTAALGVDDLKPSAPVTARRSADRLGLLQELQDGLSDRYGGGPVRAHATTLKRALELVHSEAGQVFDLSTEPSASRERYGLGVFGQGCLLARRLVEKGVPFVEVSLGSPARWDTHANNFVQVEQLSAELDAGWSALLEDLESRGLLGTTTILWMGEFGRTPKINANTGRDHFPNAWSAVLAGGGVRGGHAWGKTSPDGMTVEDGLVSPADLVATLCAALGLDHKRQNISDSGRPFRLSDGEPVRQVLA